MRAAFRLKSGRVIKLNMNTVPELDAQAEEWPPYFREFFDSGLILGHRNGGLCMIPAAEVEYIALEPPAEDDTTTELP